MRGDTAGPTLHTRQPPPLTRDLPEARLAFEEAHGLVVQKARWDGCGGTGHCDIPRSRHDPKILGRDDAEVVGDRVAEVRPIARNLFAQETAQGRAQVGATRFATD